MKAVGDAWECVLPVLQSLCLEMEGSSIKSGREMFPETHLGVHFSLVPKLLFNGKSNLWERGSKKKNLAPPLGLRPAITRCEV